MNHQTCPKCSAYVTHYRKVLVSAQILLQCQHTVGFCLQNHRLVTCLIALRKPAKAREKADTKRPELERKRGAQQVLNTFET